MITFKSYLKEEIQWQQSLSTKLFDVGQGASLGFNAFWMPISSSIMRRIWPKEVRATTFHVTNDNGYRKIKKMQGRKGSISGFFEMRSNYWEQGIQTSGGIVLELDANILGAFNQDVMSAPDKSGRRWVQLEFLKGKWGEKDLSKYQKGLQDLVGGLLEKYLPIAIKHTGKSAPKTMQKGKYYMHWADLGRLAAQEPGKKTLLNRIIKEYLDGIEDIFKKNAEHFRGLLTGYLNLRRTEEAWDEILVNNFKIKKVWIIPESRTWNTYDVNTAVVELNKIDQFKLEVITDDFPVEVAKSRVELETYIRDIVQKEAGQQ